MAIITRNVDKDVARARGRLAGAVSQGNDELASKARDDLEDAKILAAARTLAAAAPRLSPDRLEQLVSILAAVS